MIQRAYCSEGASVTVKERNDYKNHKITERGHDKYESYGT